MPIKKTEFKNFRDFLDHVCPGKNAQEYLQSQFSEYLLSDQARCIIMHQVQRGTIEYNHAATLLLGNSGVSASHTFPRWKRFLSYSGSLLMRPFHCFRNPRISA